MYLAIQDPMRSHMVIILFVIDVFHKVQHYDLDLILNYLKLYRNY